MHFSRQIEIFSIYNSIRKHQIPRNRSNKKCGNIYIEHYNISMKIKSSLNKRRDIICSRLRKFKLLRCRFFLRLICKFNEVSIRILRGIFNVIWHANSKIYIEMKKTKSRQENLEEKKQKDLHYQMSRHIQSCKN